MRNKYSDEKSRTGARRASKPAALLGALVAALIVAGLSGALPSIQRALSPEPERLSQRQDAYASWSFEEYPEYYRVVGSAVVDVELEPGEARYEGLDSLGRTGRAVALVTYDMMREGSDREREDIHEIHPSGWGHNREVDIKMPGEKTYHGALFNRSHLLAKSLGGDDAAYNLITGTRPQNVGDNRGQDGGMAYTEGIARDWLWDNPDGTVFYSATPVYEGDELLARSVIVDVRSSDGKIDLEVEVFNTAYGFDINYATGEFSVIGA